MINLTVLFIVSCVFIVAVFDVWVILNKGKQESISAHIIRNSKNYPLIVLLFGIILGHLFWPMKTEDIYSNVKCIEMRTNK